MFRMGDTEPVQDFVDYHDDEHPPTVLLVHDDRELLDLMTRVLETRGYDIFQARSGPAAVRFLRSGCHFDIVIADWDRARGVGRSLYRWMQEKRPKLCSSFIALASIQPEGFREFTGGQCQLVHSFDLAELLRATQVVLERDRPGRDPATRDASRVAFRKRGEKNAKFTVASRTLEPAARPSLLLVEDEALQRDVISDALARVGFDVTPTDSGSAAISTLERDEYDVILSDWYVGDATGGDLYQWLVAHRPAMAERCVFMSAAALEGGLEHEILARAPRQPFVSKSGGTNALLGYLTGIAARSRSQPIGFIGRRG